MHLHHINDFIQLQDVTINHYYISEDNVLFLTLCPINYLQACPSCHSQQLVISKGTRQKLRQVRHLRCFNRETILSLSIKRLFLQTLINVHSLINIPLLKEKFVILMIISVNFICHLLEQLSNS